MAAIKGGGLLYEWPHVLSRDGAVLFACCVDSVLAFSTTTSEQLYALQHPARVTSVCLHPEDDSLLYTGAADGHIMLWDLTSGTEAQRWLLDSPVESLVVDGADLAYVSCHWRQQQAGRFFAYDLAKGAASSGRAKASTARRLVASSGGRFLASVDRHTTMVWSMDRFPHNPVVLTHTKPLSCVALSTSGDMLAVGDVTGRIVFWHGIREAVMQFSPDDAYLLSGGHEGVLVVWDMSSGRRAYLPRLGTCLRNIASCSGDPSRIAVSVADNAVRMVDLASMNVQCSVRGICCSSNTSCVTVQPGTGNLAVASAAATLQLYDPASNAHIDRLQLSDTNAHRGARTVFAASKLPAPTHAVFNADAEMLVTAEQRLAVSGGMVSQIKAWRRSQVATYGHSYTLAAGEGNPWSVQDSVQALAVHPSRPLVAAALGTGDICFWELRASPRGGAWGVSRVAALQGSAASAVAFSPDGSVLAVGATTHSPVALVDPSSRHILMTLPPLLDSSQPASTIQGLAFLANGLHLVAQWDGGVAAFDLLGGGVQWAYQLPTTLMVTDPAAARCAIGTPSGAVVHLGASGAAGDAAGLLHGRHMHSAHYVGTRALLAEGMGPSTILVVLNDLQQFATSSAAAPAPAASRGGRRGSSAAAGLDAARAQRSGGAGAAPAAGGAAGHHRQGAKHVAAACQESASHLLASAAELCPLALEQLLLG